MDFSPSVKLVILLKGINGRYLGNSLADGLRSFTNRPMFLESWGLETYVSRLQEGGGWKGL